MANQEEIWSKLGEEKIINDEEIKKAITKYSNLYVDSYKKKENLVGTTPIGTAYYSKTVTEDGLNWYKRSYGVSNGYEGISIVTNQELTSNIEGNEVFDNTNIFDNDNPNLNCLKIIDRTGTLGTGKKAFFKIDGFTFMASEKGFEELGNKYKSNALEIKNKVKICLELLGIDSEKYISEFESKVEKKIEEEKSATSKDMATEELENEEKIVEEPVIKAITEEDIQTDIEEEGQEIKKDELGKGKKIEETQETQEEQPQNLVEEIVEKEDENPLSKPVEELQADKEKEDIEIEKKAEESISTEIEENNQNIAPNKQIEEVHNAEKEIIRGQINKEEPLKMYQGLSEKEASKILREFNAYTNVPMATPVKKKWREIIAIKIKELAQKGKETIENWLNR